MKNLGTADRYARLIAAVLMVVGAFALPWDSALRLPIFLGFAGYMLLTSLAGTCLGYKMMGVSSCPNQRLT